MQTEQTAEQTHEPKLLLDWNPRPNEIITTENNPKVTIVQDFSHLSFFAAIEETKQRQSATTLDNTYTLKVKTHDANIMDLGKIPPMTLVRITIEVGDRHDRVEPDRERDQYYE